jgi:ABC-type glycerol-3-phosphate transport system permease component
MIKTHIVTALVLITLWTFNTFTPFLLTGGGPAFQTEVVSIYTYRTAFQFFRFGMGGAVGMVMMLINLGFALSTCRCCARSGARQRAAPGDPSVRGSRRRATAPARRASCSAASPSTSAPACSPPSSCCRCCGSRWRPSARWPTCRCSCPTPGACELRSACSRTPSPSARWSRTACIQAGGAMLLVTVCATLGRLRALARADPRHRGDHLRPGAVLVGRHRHRRDGADLPDDRPDGLIDTHLGVILVFTGGLLPAAIFIMRDFVDSIPRSYEESAMVAGASPWAVFRDVALPIVRPGMMVVGVWAFVNVWGGFLIPFILLRSPEKMPASVAIYSFYTEAGTPLVTLTAAYSLLYTLPVLLLYLFVNWKYGFRFFGGIKS